MLQPKDLKVGNYVGATIAGEIHGSLATYQIKDGKDIDNAKWYFPIELTEDWLVNFGWAKEGKIGIYEKVGVRFQIWVTPNNKIYFLLGGNNNSVELKYVHKLQNIYSDLMEEELILIK